MKFQYVSDLHLEFPENECWIKNNPLKPVAPILILAGDICKFNDIKRYDWFFDQVSNDFEHVYWIPGNHEYYDYDIKDNFESLNIQIRDNVLLMNNESIIHEDVEFIFSTLWSKINEVDGFQIKNMLNDFNLIKHDGVKLTIDRYNSIHEKCLLFLRKSIEEQNGLQKVIITHHIPTFLNYPEQYKGQILNQCFAVELYDLIENSNVRCWVYGHHHRNIPEFKIGNTKLLTNQLGYVHTCEHKSFTNDKFYEI